MSTNKKTQIQDEALQTWLDNNCKGSLAMATGSGKSKCALLAIHYLINTLGIKKPKILLAVPTESLRDKNWLDEFVKWKLKKYYKFLDRYCYVSLNKIENEHYDLIILDELQNITENNSKFFAQNTHDRILGLSATPPSDEVKKVLVKLHCPVIYDYKLDEAVENGVVAPYKINLIEVQLDNVNKYISAGTKVKPFMTTEYNHYQYLSKQILQLKYAGKAKAAMFAQLNRQRFLGNLKSKTDVAKIIRDKYITNDRSLIFCHSIAQADEMCQYRFHSKSKGDDLTKLRAKKIDKLSCVKALNEGENIPDLDSAIIIQVNSVERNIIQQLGRIVRWRPNHEATIWILVVIGTQDEVWWNKCSENLDKQKITFINSKNL
jgi:superfamily II DNA or RNA helicase